MHITQVANRSDWYVASYRDRRSGYYHTGISDTRIGAIVECLRSIFN